MDADRNEAIEALDRQVAVVNARAPPSLVLAVPSHLAASISLEKVFEVIAFICKCLPTSCTHVFSAQEIRYYEIFSLRRLLVVVFI